jgi:hypothetical protein
MNTYHPINSSRFSPRFSPKSSPSLPLRQMRTLTQNKASHALTTSKKKLHTTRRHFTDLSDNNAWRLSRSQDRPLTGKLCKKNRFLHLASSGSVALSVFLGVPMSSRTTNQIKLTEHVLDCVVSGAPDLHSRMQTKTGGMRCWPMLGPILMLENCRVRMRGPKG